ncbi:succinate--CoA ligase subunit alpha [Azohydromonas aeria]|uniref:succinate--CoA ligase subunit alpha n=1 Tax=Azohydromonas aeria TaxID=2590212 RepID=UPI0012F72816|nr:succinate--CoA ligase subunit alpha [Azohydromonas aeria]
MSILLDRHSRVILQGGDDGSGPGCSAAWRAGGHAGRARIAAGVVYGTAEHLPDELLLFPSVREAKAWTNATASVVCVAPERAADAIVEAAEAGIGLVVCLTEHIPGADLQRVRRRLCGGTTQLLLGCAGLVTPGEVHIGPIPGQALQRGRIGVLSGSAALVSLAASQLAAFGLGESTVVALGGEDAAAAADGAGLGAVDLLRLFDADPGTDAVLLAGGLGEAAETACARWIDGHMRKPVVMLRHGTGPLPPGVRATRDPAALGALVAEAVEPQWLPFD